MNTSPHTDEAYRRGVLAEVDDARRAVLPFVLTFAAALAVCIAISILLTH